MISNNRRCSNETKQFFRHKWLPVIEIKFESPITNKTGVTDKQKFQLFISIVTAAKTNLLLLLARKSEQLQINTFQWFHFLKNLLLADR